MPSCPLCSQPFPPKSQRFDVVQAEIAAHESGTRPQRATAAQSTLPVAHSSLRQDTGADRPHTDSAAGRRLGGGGWGVSGVRRSGGVLGTAVVAGEESESGESSFDCEEQLLGEERGGGLGERVASEASSWGAPPAQAPRLSFIGQSELFRVLKAVNSGSTTAQVRFASSQHSNLGRSLGLQRL